MPSGSRVLLRGDSTPISVHTLARYFECYSSSGLLFLPPPRRSFVHRACAARRSTALRSSGLTLRHRAAPRPTAVR